MICLSNHTPSQVRLARGWVKLIARSDGICVEKREIHLYSNQPTFLVS